MNKKLFHIGFLLIAAFCLFSCEKKNNQETEKRLDITQMENICELATLKCYYHNTAKFDSEKQVLFWNTKKKLWIEYSGIVKIGVKLDKLKIVVEDNTVTITLPDAEVLGCEVDTESLSEDSVYLEEKGLGSGKIGAEEQTQAFKAAQEGMLKTVEEDEGLFLQAKARAQKLLEEYIKNVGEIIGVDYKVKWETVTGDDVMEEREKTEKE